MPLTLVSCQPDNKTLVHLLINAEIRECPGETLSEKKVHRQKAEEAYHFWIQELRKKYPAEINRTQWEKNHRKIEFSNWPVRWMGGKKIEQSEIMDQKEIF